MNIVLGALWGPGGTGATAHMIYYNNNDNENDNDNDNDNNDDNDNDNTNNDNAFWGPGGGA